MTELTHANPDILSLVADVGGTNTRVALARGTEVLAETVLKYANADHAGLEEVLHHYLGTQGDPDCAGACAAVAGPVRDGRATLTNVAWSIDKEMLVRAARAEVVAVLNDLQAQGHALGHIPPRNMRAVLPGREAGPNAAQLVIGIGTGFNASPVYNTQTGRYVPPGEAGHSTLPVRHADDASLSAFVSRYDGFPAVEDVLSGRGLGHCHAWAMREAGSAGDPMEARGIIAAVEAGRDPVARRAAEAWVRMLGTVAGDLALAYLPFGGIHLIGGMARAMTPWLLPLGFEAAFHDKGRFGAFMGTFAVGVIEDDFAALTGCASHLSTLA
jgi:glucokinase